MNAVIYARCASHDLDGLSVQSQLRACSEYAKLRPDRLARGSDAVAACKQSLKQCGVRVLSVTENFGDFDMPAVLAEACKIAKGYNA